MCVELYIKDDGLDIAFEFFFFIKIFYVDHFG